MQLATRADKQSLAHIKHLRAARYTIWDSMIHTSRGPLQRGVVTWLPRHVIIAVPRHQHRHVTSSHITPRATFVIIITSITAMRHHRTRQGEVNSVTNATAWSRTGGPWGHVIAHVLFACARASMHA